MAVSQKKTQGVKLKLNKHLYSCKKCGKNVPQIYGTTCEKCYLSVK